MSIPNFPSATNLNTQAASNVSTVKKRYIISKDLGDSVILVPTAGDKQPVQVLKSQVLAEVQKGTIVVKGLDLTDTQNPKFKITNNTVIQGKKVQKATYDAMQQSVDDYIKNRLIASEILYDTTKKKPTLWGYVIEWIDPTTGELKHHKYSKAELETVFENNSSIEIINLTHRSNGGFTQKEKNFMAACDAHNLTYSLENYRTYMISQIKNSESVNDVIESATHISNGPTVKRLPAVGNPKRIDFILKSLSTQACIIIQTNPTKGTVKAELGTTSLEVLERIGFDASTWAVHYLAKTFMLCCDHNSTGVAYPEPVQKNFDKGTYQKLLSCSLRARLKDNNDPESPFELSTPLYGTYMEHITGIIELGYGADAQSEWDKIIQNNYLAGTYNGQHLSNVSSILVKNIKDEIEKHAKTIPEIANYLLSSKAVNDLWSACKKSAKEGGGIGLVSNPNKFEYAKFLDSVKIVGNIYKNGGVLK